MGEEFKGEKKELKDGISSVSQTMCCSTNLMGCNKQQKKKGKRERKTQCISNVSVKSVYNGLQCKCSFVGGSGVIVKKV